MTGKSGRREREIVRLRTVEGLTFQEIGGRYGISRERVRQILNRYYFHGGGSEGMSTILRGHPAARGVVARLRAEGQVRDARAKREAASARAAGRRLDAGQRAELFRDAPIAVADDAAALLYVLARGHGGRVVEFGASLGVSTIHLAAGVRDGCAGGSLITTEIDPLKARALSRNLRQAEFGDLVEVRVGDALRTLSELEGPVDLLFLDGWNDLYLPVLKLLEPRLSPDAAVVADLTADDPDLEPYLRHVRDPNGGWVSTTLPLDAGVEISLRAIGGP